MLLVDTTTFLEIASKTTREGSVQNQPGSVKYSAYAGERQSLFLPLWEAQVTMLGERKSL